MLQSPTMASSCPSCGAEVIHGETAEGETVPLERWTSPDGENRYRIVKFVPNGHHLVEKIQEAMVDGYPDHREDCPAHANGLRGITVS